MLVCVHGYPDDSTAVERWAPDLRTHTVPGGHWLPRTHAGEIARLVAGHADRADLAEPAPPTNLTAWRS